MNKLKIIVLIFMFYSCKGGLNNKNRVSIDNLEKRINRLEHRFSDLQKSVIDNKVTFSKLKNDVSRIKD